MMKSSLFEISKSCLYAHNLKNSKAALLRYIITIQDTPILYHKLPKIPVFLQATVKPFFEDFFFLPSEQLTVTGNHVAIP